MNFTIDRSALLSAMSRLSGVVNRRNTIPILANVWISTDKKSLTLRVTDLDMEATVTVPATVSEKGVITVPAGLLTDIVKSVNEGAKITAKMEGERLIVSSGRARWKLPTLSADQFPDLTKTEWAVSVPVTSEILSDTVGRVAWAVHPPGAKEFLQGVRMAVRDGILYATASNSAQLAFARSPCDAPDFSGATIPPKMAALISGFEGEDIRLNLTGRRAGIEGGGASITSKVIDRPYPDEMTEGLRTQERPLVATFDRNALTIALKRVLLASEEAGVRLTLSDGVIAVSGRGEFSEGADEVEADFTGEATMGFLGRRFIDMLNMLDGERATLSFAPDEPVLLSAGDGSAQAISVLMLVA